jgi:hypothetical protein
MLLIFRWLGESGFLEKRVLGNGVNIFCERNYIDNECSVSDFYFLFDAGRSMFDVERLSFKLENSV